MPLAVLAADLLLQALKFRGILEGQDWYFKRGNPTRDGIVQVGSALAKPESSPAPLNKV